MDDCKVIDALGGGAAISRALSTDAKKLDATAVRMWKQRGLVPWKWRIPVADLVDERRASDPKLLPAFDREQFLRGKAA